MATTRTVRHVMVPITQAEQARLAKVARRHMKSLMRKAGIEDVGIGYRFRRGKPTGELAVIVRVAKKVPLAKLAPKDRVPPAVDGIRTDVLEGVTDLLAGPYDLHDPLLGGVSVAAPGGSGTMGCIVFDRQTAQPFGLTNHHVMLGATELAAKVCGTPAQEAELRTVVDRAAASWPEAECAEVLAARADPADALIWWITQEHDTQDVVLRAGDTWVVERNGLTLLEAQEDSTFCVLGRALATWVTPRPARASPATLAWRHVCEAVSRFLAAPPRAHVPYA